MPVHLSMQTKQGNMNSNTITFSHQYLHTETITGTPYAGSVLCKDVFICTANIVPTGWGDDDGFLYAGNCLKAEITSVTVLPDVQFPNYTGVPLDVAEVVPATLPYKVLNMLRTAAQMEYINSLTQPQPSGLPHTQNITAPLRMAEAA